jgi:hypothetical protein
MTTLFFIGIGFLCLPIVGMLLLNILSQLSSSAWFCKQMKWHIEPNENTYDVSTGSGKCPRCNKKVTRDSYGNWV